MLRILRMRMRMVPALFTAVLLSTPLVVSAHAIPVDSSPAASAVVQSAPKSVAITFSEHIDEAASGITVIGPSGTETEASPATTNPSDTHILFVPIRNDGTGTYIVKWSSVSSDDGHFTRGSFAFAVGAGQTISSAAASQDTEIVELSTTPEAIASGFELAGHGFLWAVLLLFACAIRPLLGRDEFAGVAPLIRRGYGLFLGLGASLAVLGGIAQIVIKTLQLAQLREVALMPALWLYLGTDAGFATAVRIGAAIAIAIIYIAARGRITHARRITPYEIAIIVALLIFAFFRAKISHATSNPFHPDLSIAVNFLHVIEKDVWAGIVGILFVMISIKRLRAFLAALIPRAFAVIAIDFSLVSVTASYIIWLHLKSFGNLFTTQWGTTLLQLLIPAVLVVAMRTYHTLARWRARALFDRFLPATLGVEFAFALLVVYCSSVVIITSPPLSSVPSVFKAHDQGVTIALARDPFEDGMLELALKSAHTLAIPTITAQSGSEEPIVIELQKRFDGGYVFPSALLSGAGPFAIAVTVPQTGAYDAHALFNMTRADLTPEPEGSRPFDFFTAVMCLIALLALIYGLLLYWLSWKESAVSGAKTGAFAATITFSVSFAVCAAAIVFLGTSSLANPFKATCLADGNEWHVMLPSIAGKPTSQTPAEGCMWGMGAYMYMFSDARQYSYNMSLGGATGTLALSPQQPRSGVPTTLTISLKNQDGSPATLFIDMEKVMHVVIVSKDESVYAHIHPDDFHPLTPQEIDSSTYTLTYTFPKAGDYLVMVDYAHGLALESKQFQVHVDGAPAEATNAREYPTEGTFDGYDVSLRYPLPIAGQVETMVYTITKSGAPVTLVPYLSAAMHVTVVKNDFSWHLHAHGEVHPPGTPLPPIIVKNGQVIHSMASMVTPETFTSPIETHVIFPTPGLYTVWGQFKTEDGDLVASSFTVRVEE